MAIAVGVKPAFSPKTSPTLHDTGVHCTKIPIIPAPLIISTHFF